MAETDSHTLEAERVANYRALVEYGLAAGIGIGHSLGITLESLGEGRAVWTLLPLPRTADAQYTVAGGVLATLMEAATSSAVHSVLPPRTTFAASGLTVALVGTVRVHDPEICCEASVLHLGGRTATAEARVLATDGRLVAHGTAAFLLFPVPSG